MRKQIFLWLILFLLTSPCSQFSAQTKSDHLLIIEIQIAGSVSSQDYLKIYNPTDEPLDISGFRLRKRSQAGKEYSLRVFPAGSQIKPKEFLIWANAQDGFADLIQAPYQSQASLSSNNSVALLDSQGFIVDAVAWGKGKNPFGEGAPFPQNPGANQPLKRKQLENSYIDSNSNQEDFFLEQLTSSPKPGNLILGNQTPQPLSKWLILGLGLGLGILSAIIILFLKRNYES